ncbi:MAG: alpha/beta fold hydrolase [Alphaproteobacteria bacterium]|nr:alpha/beta fold hydrolase [Alphaproteobacteria bacterium]MBU1515696.1 alpha/beta fold hydrolase [Alphaproteobacteria bacterium]MBU2096979.1 alpha/beta fold hydrolase [Alphaproteobacteria bacterium]MBU2149495.1 alpha/beta fold hydrolase [Alphaproteobacteria bacterium]MBU2308881.1 alpha/beta fold hydrolase [Alphaproteobacteria bacterium]
MTSRALLFGTAFALALGSTALAQPAKREVGNIVYDGAPATPAALQAALAPYYNARAAGFDDWLPDGAMLIVTRFGDTSQIHRVASPGAARTQLTFFSEPISQATVRPGTSTYLYPRDVGGAEYYQGYIRDLVGRETQLTAPGTRNQNFVFSKDGKLVAWSQVTPGDPNYDVMLADPANPEGRRKVHDGTGAIAVRDISADGRTILVARNNAQTWVELFTLDVASGKLSPVGPTGRKIGYLGGVFVDGGKGVLTLSDDGAEMTRPVVINVASGVVRDLEPGAKWGTEDFDLSPDGATVAQFVNEEGYSKIVLRDVASGKVLASPTLPKGVLGTAKFSPDGQKLGFGLSTSRSMDVWSYDLKTGQLTQWTQSELGGLDPAKLVEPALFRYPTFDGKQIPAFIYKPPSAATQGGKNGGGKLPVVIQIHGGPEGQELPAFNPRRQSWVNELGAAVIIPNVRGSSGYGKTYLGLDNAEKREDSVKDIGALLDWVAKQPDLDASRVAVVGQSYGGYMVLAVAGHYNDRVAGIIDLYGISNWVTFLKNTEGYRRDLRRAEYGDERDPKMLAVFEKISPIVMSDKMKTPMMVFQGANDPRVPRTESEQMVAKLRAQGTEVWYVLAKDEGHGIYKKANQEAVRATEVVFLKKVLSLP